MFECFISNTKQEYYAFSYQSEGEQVCISGKYDESKDNPFVNVATVLAEPTEIKQKLNAIGFMEEYALAQSVNGSLEYLPCRAHPMFNSSGQAYNPLSFNVFKHSEGKVWACNQVDTGKGLQTFVMFSNEQTKGKFVLLPVKGNPFELETAKQKKGYVYSHSEPFDYDKFNFINIK
ncbi:hypothetical protein [uncultured Pseudoalteromonas sp.]|uniref:hypothetical protein n=1 Tax=uncultured Pseudoalteromonas sp. TaxID=114053 RepID=UPI002591B47D|nr:hypothetical protein [uncultured Pseudoalteromonas sp.]